MVQSAMRRLNARDVIGGMGLGLLGAGLWLWWPPAALMVTGGILVLVALGSGLLTRGNG